MKLAASGVDSRVVDWVREFLVGHTQRVRVEGQLSEEVKVLSLVNLTFLEIEWGKQL